MDDRGESIVTSTAETRAALPTPTLIGILVLALIGPTIIAWIYFVILAGAGERNALQQIVYAAGKVVQFSLPVVVVLGWERQRPRMPAAPLAGLGQGLLFGLVVAAAMTVLYLGMLRDSSLFAEMPARILQKVRELGVDTPGRFLALSVFIAALHSLLEEYYWRWFVFGRLRELLPFGLAAVVSGLGFMAHHVIVLGVYLPGQLVTVVLPFSLAIAVGGIVWAWQYERTGTLAGPWLGHLIIDATIFAIGWDMIRGG